MTNQVYKLEGISYPRRFLYLFALFGERCKKILDLIEHDDWLEAKEMEWLNGKSFAFTIIDDTDEATVANVKPIYDLLAELGIWTTKTVGPFPEMSWRREPF